MCSGFGGTVAILRIIIIIIRQRTAGELLCAKQFSMRPKERASAFGYFVVIFLHSGPVSVCIKLYNNLNGLPLPHEHNSGECFNVPTLPKIKKRKNTGAEDGWDGSGETNTSANSNGVCLHKNSY